MGARGLPTEFATVRCQSETSEIRRIARVSYADLDLATPAAIDRMHGRLRHAAAAVCEQAIYSGFRQQAIEQRCIARAFDHGLAQLHRVQLTAARSDETRGEAGAARNQ